MFLKCKKISHIFVMVLLSTILLLPNAALAASSGSWTPATGLTVAVSGATDTSYTDGKVTVTAKGKNGWLGSLGSESKTATIDITNGSDGDAQVSFNIEKTQVNSFTSNGGGLNTDSTEFSLKMTAGATVKLTLTTANNATENKVVLSNFKREVMDADAKATITFDSTKGSVTAGSSITSGTELTPTDGKLSLVATPAEGYVFLGWVNSSTREVLSYAASETLPVPKTITLEAVFADSETEAWFTVNNILYENWSSALSAAGTSGTIALAADGTLPEGDYNIPSGVTLLIPYDTANTLVTNDAEKHLKHAYDDTKATRTQFRQLTLADGANITVASGGAISIGSQASNQFMGQIGSYGAIYMAEDSTITVANGGTLYAWGYIFYGEEVDGEAVGGTVTVESGGTVYEPMSIMDYPGSASLTTTLNDNKVFPMRAYTARNVEVPMTLQYGANEYAFYCLYGDRVGTHPGYFLLIGKEKVNNYTPAFQPTNGTSLVKSHKSGTQYLEANGSLSINSLSVTISVQTWGGLGQETITVKTSDTTGFYIPSGYDVTLNSGTLTLNDNLIMTEGSKFTIAHGATFDTNGKKLYVVDATEDVGAVATTNGCSITVQDVHGKYYTQVNKDAVLDVNGTLKTSGGFYTSTSGASITSTEGTGKIEITGATGNTSIKIKDASSKFQTIAMTAAKLQNKDGNYVETGVATYNYINDIWHEGDCKSNAVVEIEAIPPTCTEPGVDAKSACGVCGAEVGKQEAIPATGHTEVTDAAVAPGCTTTGLTEGSHCSACNKVFVAQETIAALGHTPAGAVEENRTEATCGKDGSYNSVVYCSVCTAKISSETVTLPATGNHTAGTAVEENRQEPTCTEAGSYDSVVYCSVCGTKLGSEQKSIPAKGHIYTTSEIAPTCTEQGYTLYDCNNCDYSYKDHYVDAGHPGYDNGYCTGCEAYQPAGEVIDENGFTVYQISNAGQLFWYAEKGNGYSAVLTADIVVMPEFSEKLVIWSPMGNEYMPWFMDTFDGQGHTISGLYCMSPNNSYVGLFGNVSGTIKNLGVVNSTISGKTHVGAIVGSNTNGNLYLSNCWSDSTVNGKNWTGGLVGVLKGGTIEQSWYTGKVTVGPDGSGMVTYGGGIVGAIEDYYNNSAVNNCWNAGEVSCVSNEAAGYAAGIVGNTKDTNGKVTNCYDVGNISGDYVGQIVACVGGEVTISNCYYLVPSLDGEEGSEGMIPKTEEQFASGEVAYLLQQPSDLIRPPEGPVQIWGQNIDNGEPAQIYPVLGGAKVYGNSVCDGAAVVYSNAEAEAAGHSYDAGEVTEPSCSEGGYTTYTCVHCGETHTDNVTEALGHTEVIDAAVAATCTTTGKTEGKHCSVCDTVIVAQEVIPVIEHDMAAGEVVKPTCTEDGYTVYTCTKCPASENRDVVASNGHKYETVVTTAPTCGAQGYTTYTCHCGDSKVDDYVAALGHDMVTDAAVAPTCTTTGLTEGAHCSRCADATTKQNEVPALGHNPAAAVEENRVDATCKAAGSYDSVVKCSVCGVEISREAHTIEKLPHTEVVDNAVAATCTTTGLTEGKHCSVCDTVIVAQETIPVKGHNMRESAAAVAPTCTTTGKTAVLTCANGCGLTEGGATVDALGHTEVIDEAVAPDCTNTGKTEGKHCSVCGTVIAAQEVVDALGHTKEVLAGKDATCTETGLTAGEKCSVCGETLTAQTEIPALGHTEGEVQVEKQVAATCTVDGSHDEVIYCTVCEEEVSRTSVTDKASGHTLVNVDAKEATCTEDGHDAYEYCTVCDYTTYKEVAATGHSYDAWYTVTPATCTVDGEERHDCANCDHFETRAAAAAGHTEVIDAAVAPTCTATGKTEGKHCSVCDTVIVAQEVIPVIEHDMVAGEVVEPTCTEDGYTVYTCTKCPASENRDVVASNGHKYETAVTTAPTCGAQGYTTYTCRCGDSKVDNYVDALGHDMVIDAAVAPTCTTTGLTEGAHCSRCADATTKQNEVPALGHNPATAVEENRVDATCKAAGSYDSVVKCSVCGVEISREAHTIEKLPHTEAVVEGYAATCTETGLKDGVKCSVCNEVIVAQETIPVKGHDMQESAAAVAPTCTTTGKTAVLACANGCGLTEGGATVDALGHTEVVDNAVAATCTATGLTEGKHCSVCGTVTVAQTVVDALGHTWTDATCTKAKTCSVCGASEGSVLDHSFIKYSSIGGDLERAECAYGCKTTHTRVTENGVSDQDQVVTVEPETSESENHAQVAVGKELLADIADDGLQLHLNSKILKLAFNNQALNAILDSLTELVQLVEISTENITPSSAVDKMVFDIHLKVDGKKVEKSDFGAGEVTVTIPLDGLTIPTGKIVKVWHVDGDQRSDMNAAYDRKNGTVTFQTSHFSEFEVLPEVCDGHTYENGTCTKCETTQTVPYKAGQSVQIGIEEPWFLQANARIYPEGAGSNAHIDYSTLEDFGFYFVRRSQLADQSVTQNTITKETIMSNEHMVQLSKGNGAYINGIYISARYDEGLYTYEMNDGIFVLGYYVQDGETVYMPIRERVMIDIIKAEKDKDIYTAEVKATYQGLSDLYDAVVAYHNGRPVLDKAQKAPTLAEYELGRPTANGPYNFAHTMQVRTIEPWGLRFNSRISDPTVAPAGSVDYSALDEYGVVIYYDRAEEIAGTMTAEELLARKDAYVFSSLNDDMVINGKYVYATYNKDIYTYEMDKNMYVMFYYQMDGSYYYGPVKTRNILTALDETLKVVEPGSAAYDVVVSMKSLNRAIVAYQAAAK